jgi:non-ribosomal peptide synthase protein (TIGR01720 family)
MHVSGGLIGSYSPIAQRSHVLEINAFVLDDRLQFDVIYSKALHHPETIHNLADRCIAALDTLIRACLSPGEDRFTATDFPLATLDDKKLSQLAARLDRLDA